MLHIGMAIWRTGGGQPAALTGKGMQQRASGGEWQRMDGRGGGVEKRSGRA